MIAAYSGCAILSSYLVLFIAFYIDVYRRKDSTKSKLLNQLKVGLLLKLMNMFMLQVFKFHPIQTPQPKPYVPERHK